MAVRAKDVGTELTLVKGGDGTWLLPESVPANELRDGGLLYEQALARAEAAEAQAQQWRRAEIEARSKAGSWKSQAEASRAKLADAREEAKAVRRTAKDALSLQAEVTRLRKLLDALDVDDEGSGTPASILVLRTEVVRLRRRIEPLRQKNAALLEANKARTASAARPTTQSPSGEQVRLRKALEKSLERERKQKDTIESLRRKNAKLRSQARTAEARKATIGRWRGKNAELRKEKAELLKQVRTLKDQPRLIGRLNDEIQTQRVLNRGLRTHHEKAVLQLREEIGWLHRDVERARELYWKAATDKERRFGALRKRILRQDASARRARRTIGSLRERNAELRAQTRVAKAERAQMAERVEALEAELAKLGASRAVLSKRLHGRKSERQQRPRSKRRRGQQPGAPGHGRTPRPGLEERVEIHQPPAEASVCSGCDTAYVSNGERCTAIVEIDVKAHKRLIVRPRWRRACECKDSPREVTAPPPDRLFPRTPYGISVWACMLFERYACHRPLNGAAGWLSDQGLAISAGTLGNSVARFVPLFDPVAQAILEHQNHAAVRHGDETGWRVQAFKQAGHSTRAWLWVSATRDAVYFHIDRLRNAEVALAVFGAAALVQVLVVDRLSTYKKLARVLQGRVILAWCWVHQRRDFIHCAAAQQALTEWSQTWIERIASIYRLNKARLSHYEPGAPQQDEAFAAAQQALQSEVKDLFATAEGELAGLDEKAAQAGPLRSLLNHREGLSVFLERPDVPMDNNFAERSLRGAVIERRLTFGSDSEQGARLTAIMYSVVRTLALNGLDVRRWLREWLKACAAHGGRAPPHKR